MKQKINTQMNKQKFQDPETRKTMSVASSDSICKSKQLRGNHTKES